MWDDEQNVRAALHAELAQQAPPARHGLADVLSHGRRRRRMRQAGAVIAVLVLVTGIGVTIAAFDAARVTAPDKRVAAVPGPTSQKAEPAGPNWTKANLPPRTPDRIWRPGNTAAPPPGRTILEVPQCVDGTITRWQGAGQATDQLRRQLHAALTAVAGPATVGELVERHIPANPKKRGSIDFYDYSADISDANGTGSVRLTVGSFTADPVEAADQEAFDLFNCEPPKRLMMGNRTVLQLYPVQPSEPFQSLTQTLRIYLPGGTRYQLDMQNCGSPDFEPNPAQPEIPNRVGAGRATLPLTEDQLATLGLTMATP